MKRNITIIAFSLLMAQQATAVAGDAGAGKQLSQSKGCVGCHGASGISPAGSNYPNLAGQKAAYLETALKAYRDKARNAPLMNGMAAGLSDADISNLAAHFSSLKPCP